jgi:hypothetical protein
VAVMVVTMRPLTVFALLLRTLNVGQPRSPISPGRS